MTKDEILEAIRRCARKLGRNPTREDLTQLEGIRRSEMNPHFGLLSEAVRAAGLKISGKGFSRDNATLLRDWAGVARKLGAIPSFTDYQDHGSFSPGTLIYRFRRWQRIPEAFLSFVRSTDNESEWADVVGFLELEKKKKAELTVETMKEEKQQQAEAAAGGNYTVETIDSRTAVDSAPLMEEQAAEEAWAGAAGKSESSRGVTAGEEFHALPPGIEPRPPVSASGTLPRSGPANLQLRRARTFEDRPTYGTPLWLPGLSNEPTNEQGVIFLFALLAWRLGFVVERLQAGFPDCEALRQIYPGRWQRVAIEFEYESRNFEKHGHPAAGCDLIVCWLHNWPECPETIEVIELCREIRRCSV